MSAITGGIVFILICAGAAATPAKPDTGNLVKQQVYFNGDQRMFVCTYQGLDGTWQVNFPGYAACPMQASR
jgi:hypothetical protein